MFHRRRMGATINSTKHYVQRANLAVPSGTRTSFLISNSVVLPATGATSEVREGSVIKAIFIELWLKGQGASDSDTQFNIAFEKVDGASPAGIDFTEMQNMGSYDNKKNILFTSQGVIGGIGGGQSIPVMRSWFKIPKGKQRQGLGDFIQVSIASTGEILNVCGLATYKEYF